MTSVQMDVYYSVRCVHVFVLTGCILFLYMGCVETNKQTPHHTHAGIFVCPNFKSRIIARDVIFMVSRNLEMNASNVMNI